MAAATAPTMMLVVITAVLAGVLTDCAPRTSANVAPRPGDVSLRIASPAPNDTPSAGALRVRVEYRGPGLVPGAESQKLTDYHLHYFLDEDAAPYLGTEIVIPSGNPKILHSAAQEVTFENVAAGAHTVTVVLTGNNHISVSPATSDKVTFTIR